MKTKRHHLKSGAFWLEHESYDGRVNLK